MGLLTTLENALKTAALGPEGAVALGQNTPTTTEGLKNLWDKLNVSLGTLHFNPNIAKQQMGGYGTISFDSSPYLKTLEEQHPVLNVLNHIINPMANLPNTAEAKLAPKQLHIGMIPILGPEILDETSLAHPEVIATKMATEQARKAEKLFDIKRIQKIANQAHDEFVKTGGATIDLGTGRNMAGTNNFAVSVRPDLSQVFEGKKITPEQIANFIKTNKNDLNDPHNALGLWTDGNKTYLDVTAITPSKERAINLGRKANQIAITDLSKVKKGMSAPDEAFINTEGTGELPEGFQIPDLSDVPTPVWETLPFALKGAMIHKMSTRGLVEHAHHTVEGIKAAKEKSKKKNE